MANHLEGYKCWVCPEDTASTEGMCESGAVRHSQFFFSTTYINNEVMDVMDKCLFVMDGIDGFLKQKKADSGVRYGAFMPCIPITRRVGDFSHCAARVVNALLKRLEQSLLTENIFKIQHSQGLFDASIRWCRSAEDCASGDEGRC